MIKQKIKERMRDLESLRETLTELNLIIEETDERIKVEIKGYKSQKLRSKDDSINDIKNLILSKNALNIYRVEVESEIGFLRSLISEWASRLTTEEQNELFETNWHLYEQA